MARVNLWLRGARGKFAGSSLSKGANGETIAREVVTPRNPNTDKQLYQRMIMATVMAAYAAGKEIFDHSFQGKAKGSECQQEFMQRNLNNLRTRIAKDLRDIQEGTVTIPTCKTVVSGPKTRTAVPGRFLISDGTYYQRFFTLKATQGDPVLAIPASNTNETVAAYASRNGLIPGDIYTLCALMPAVEEDPVWIGVDASGKPTSEAWDNQPPCYFQFWRIQVKDVSNDTTPIGAVTTAGVLSKLFNLTAYVDGGAGTSYALEIPTSATFKCADVATISTVASATTLGTNFSIGSFGIIRSRFDQDLRSNTEMATFIHDDMDTSPLRGQLLCGISSGSALIQWKRAVESLGTSDLILESNS